MALPLIFFAGTRLICLSRQWDGCPLGLELVVEDRPTDFSCIKIEDIIISSFEVCSCYVDTLLVQ